MRIVVGTPEAEEIGRVWYDENEITDRCFALDRDTATAECYKRDNRGFFVEKDGVLEVEVLTGGILMVELKKEASASP